EIREMGRATQGVTLIALDEGTRLSGLQRIVENDANEPAEPGVDPAGEVSTDSPTDTGTSAGETA
ncbi:MAG: gyrase subunit, partial [Pseudomonadota bacterium]